MFFKKLKAINKRKRTKFNIINQVHKHNLVTFIFFNLVSIQLTRYK